MKKLVLLSFIILPQLVCGQSTILKNVNIIDVVNERITSNQSIEIKSGIIINIHDSTYEGNMEDSVIDLKGKFVIPGLIDSHTHIEHSAYWTEESKYNPPRENLLALLNHALLGGITTIREMACDVRVVGELSRAAKLNLIPSPNIIYPSLFAGPDFFTDPRTAAATLGETSGETSWFRAITDSTDLFRAIAEVKGNGSDAIKLYALLTKEQITSITKEARNQDLLVWSHAFTQLAKPSEIISSGANDVSHAPLLMYEFSNKPDYPAYTLEDPRLDRVFKLMISNDVSLDPTVFVFHNVTRVNHMANAAELITFQANKAGVRIIAGTDSISAYRDVPYPFIHDEMAYYTNKCGLSTMEAIQSATINSAITMNIDNELGSIEIGKKANMVILDRNPVENIQNTKSIVMTIKNGIIYRRID